MVPSLVLSRIAKQYLHEDALKVENTRVHGRGGIINGKLFLNLIF